MAGIVEPIPVQDWGSTIRNALGVYQGIKQSQAQSAQQEKQKEIEQLSQQSVSDPVAWEKLKRMDPQRASQIQQVSGVDFNKFYKERGITALSLIGKSKEQRLSILQDRLAMLKERGSPDTAGTEKMIQMVANDDPQLETTLQNILEQSYQSGNLERPPQQKQEGEYRIATTEEKVKAGLDPKTPYQISPKGQFVSLGNKGQTINVNTGDTGKIGTIPPGYAARINPKTGLYEMYSIKGGPAEKEDAEKAKADKLLKEQQLQYADIVVEDVDRAISILENESITNPVTGPLGQAAEGVWGSESANLRALYDTIEANSAFERLDEMRRASKTGGALGAISERELTLLAASKGSIKRAQSKQQQLRALKRYKELYTGIMLKAQAYPNAEQFGFGKFVANQPTGSEQREATQAVNQPQMPQEMLDRYK